MTFQIPGGWNYAGSGLYSSSSTYSLRRPIEAGDRVRLGALELEVLGTLVKSPPQASAFGAFAPQVFLPRGMVPDTELLSARSLATCTPLR